MRRRYLSVVSLCFVLCLLSISTLADEHSKKTSTKSGADQVWKDLMAGNERFVNDKLAAKNLSVTRRKLADHQNPKVIVLGCADSRVPPEMLFDKNLGDLFVVRSAGNFADRNGIASIEYAIEHLGSSLLVVLGHSSCGAVTAACSGSRMPSENLQALADTISPSCHKTGADETPQPLQPAVEANVKRSADELLNRSKIVHEAVQEGKLTIIHAVYDLSTGRVRRLD